jgi:hypothetical protein
MRSNYLLIWICAVSCQSRQETVLKPQVDLFIDEVLLPFNEDIPNVWIGPMGILEVGERILHLYNPYNKSILQFSLDQQKLVNKISPFSDTLDPENQPINLLRMSDGYFIFDRVNLGFLLTDDAGNLLNRWDYYIPRKNRINNWEYPSKHRIRPSKTNLLSMITESTIPIYIELANVGPFAVYMEDFYEHDLFGMLDLKTGDLRRYLIRFPESFNRNGFSYPMNLIPSFTASGAGKIAFLFGIDDTIHILDTATGEVKDYTVSNPNFPINIQAVDQMTINDRAVYTELSSNMSYYAGLYYDPFRRGLVRMGIKPLNDKTTRIYELLDEGLTIVGQFEQPNQYSPTPMFFPNEIWFPFQLGYKEDGMKLMRVRMDN